MKGARSQITSAEIQFTRRPVDVPADLRPNWLIACVLLALWTCCRGQKSSTRRIHALVWALLTKETMELFEAVVERRAGPESLVVRFDPSVSRAISLALGLKLLQPEANGKVRLSDKGKAFVASLLDADVFVRERAFLETMKNRVHEEQVGDLLYWRGDR